MSISTAILPPLRLALEEKGYADLTPVQEAMLADETAGRDLLVSAQTGSGKTVAFGLAMAADLLGNREVMGQAGHPQALVIAPTRELALQVSREFEWLYAKASIRMATCVGGMEMRKEIRALQQGAHIVVGTPGRLRDHITRGSLELDDLKVVVLDEADEMLDLGFREDLEFILDAAPKSRRTMMFSATVPNQIAKLATTYQKDALRVATVGEKRQHADIEYRLMPVAPHERENAIINALIYFDAPATMVFCSTREAVKHLTSRLSNRGFGVVSLSGEMGQGERNAALQSMRDGRSRICVATDVAARGIDLPNLDLVIHADMPTNPDTLLHRSGRTGRAGRKGVCVIVAPLHRRRTAERLLKLAKLEATVVRAPSQADIAEKERERLLESLKPVVTATPEEADTLAAIVKSASMEDLALAYLRLIQSTRPSGEELTDTGEPDTMAPSGEKAADRFDNGVWFRIAQGRKSNVEPRWLLPTLCKAGHLTKKDIGFIRILDHETRFEVHPDKADAFLEAITHSKSEKGLNVTRFVGDPSVLPPRRDKPAYGSDKPRFNKDKPAYTKDKPAYAKDKPAYTKDKPAYAKDKPAFQKPAGDGQQAGAGESTGDKKRRWTGAEKKAFKKAKAKPN